MSNNEVRDGRVYFDEGRACWFHEDQLGEVRTCGRWPHPDLFVGRDENRRVRVVDIHDSDPNEQVAILEFLDVDLV